MKMINSVLSAWALGQKKSIAPSALIKPAHFVERTGLATVGGACGLFVAVGLMRSGNEFLESPWIALLIMIYGAFAFYLGVDLPTRPAQQVSPIASEECNDETLTPTPPDGGIHSGQPTTACARRRPGTDCGTVGEGLKTVDEPDFNRPLRYLEWCNGF